MRSPMHYQVSEFDCGPTTFINALIYLYEREKIPSELIKAIYKYTLDEKECKGTSKKATAYLVKWLNNYSKNNKFKIDCIRYNGSIVNTNLIKREITKDSVIIVRLWVEWEHYILVTGMEDGNFYIFDPVYGYKKEHEDDLGIEIVLNNDFWYNRIVDINRLDSDNKKEYYAMGDLEKRECIIIRRNYNDI